MKAKKRRADTILYGPMLDGMMSENGGNAKKRQQHPQTYDETQTRQKKRRKEKSQIIINMC